MATKASPASKAPVSAPPSRLVAALAANAGKKQANHKSSPVKGGDATHSPSPRVREGHFTVSKPKPTGDELKDDQARALWNTKLLLMQEIVDNDTHTMPLWDKIQERLKRSASQGDLDGEERFAKAYPTLKKLIDEELEWVVGALAHVSGWEPARLLAIAKKDPDAIEKLLTAETQILSKWRIPAKCLVKKFMFKLICKLSQLFGRRMRTYGEDVVRADHSVDWANIGFLVEWTDHKMSKVIHRATRAQVVDCLALGFDDSYKFVTPWSDFSSAFVSRAGAPSRLTKLFAGNDGPRQHDDPMREKVMLEHMQEITEELRAELSLDPAVNAASENATEFAEIADSKLSERRKRMSVLREKAVDDMKKKVAKTEFDMKQK